MLCKIHRPDSQITLDHTLAVALAAIAVHTLALAIALKGHYTSTFLGLHMPGNNSHTVFGSHGQRTAGTRYDLLAEDFDEVASILEVGFAFTA